MAGVVKPSLILSRLNLSDQNMVSFDGLGQGVATPLEKLLGPRAEQRRTNWEAHTLRMLPHHTLMVGLMDVTDVPTESVIETELSANMCDFILLEDEEPAAMADPSVLTSSEQTTRRTRNIIAPNQFTTQEIRTYVMGQAKENILQATAYYLPRLSLSLPTKPDELVQRTMLGKGEACFLRAQSALWAWRTHQQRHLDLHTDGPPAVDRSVILQQRIGPITVLQGCRVLEVDESERHWSYSLGSLEDQVFQLKEYFSLEWNQQDEIWLEVKQSLQLNKLGIGLIAPAVQAMRRSFLKGYVRVVRELAEI